jgi:hypothetical protein
MVPTCIIALFADGVVIHRTITVDGLDHDYGTVRHRNFNSKLWLTHRDIETSPILTARCKGKHWVNAVAQEHKTGSEVKTEDDGPRTTARIRGQVTSDKPSDHMHHIASCILL